MSNTFDKISVLDLFIEEVNSYLPEIGTNLERLTQSPSDMDALEETYRRTHTIGGSASMMDFPVWRMLPMVWKMSWLMLWMG